MARLNDAEMRAMQSPWRRVSQRHVEMRVFARLLRRAAIELSGGRILEVGCGSGYGLSLIHERFEPARLAGFDLMPEQIALARERAVPCAEVWVGNVTHIDESEASFDAVFVFGILHHVPPWREALKEIARVLAPGGVLLIEELSGGFVDFEDRFLGMQHPKEARFEWDDFRAGLHDAGLSIVAERRLLLEAARAFLARKP